MRHVLLKCHTSHTEKQSATTAMLQRLEEISADLVRFCEVATEGLIQKDDLASLLGDVCVDNSEATAMQALPTMCDVDASSQPRLWDDHGTAQTQQEQGEREDTLHYTATETADGGKDKSALKYHERSNILEAQPQKRQRTMEHAPRARTAQTSSELVPSINSAAMGFGLPPPISEGVGVPNANKSDSATSLKLAENAARDDAITASYAYEQAQTQTYGTYQPCTAAATEVAMELDDIPGEDDNVNVSSGEDVLEDGCDATEAPAIEELEKHHKADGDGGLYDALKKLLEVQADPRTASAAIAASKVTSEGVGLGEGVCLDGDGQPEDADPSVSSSVGELCDAQYEDAVFMACIFICTIEDGQQTGKCSLLNLSD